MPGMTTEDTKVKPDRGISDEEKNLEAPTDEPTPDQGKKDSLEGADLARAAYDDDYREELNAKLTSEDEGKDPDDSKEGERATPAAAADKEPGEGDADPVVGKGIYNGQEFEIRESEKVALWQKGRHLDNISAEYGDVITAMKRNPELRKLVQAANASPQLAKAVMEAAEGVYTGRADERLEESVSLGEIPGVDPDDAEVVGKVVAALEAKKAEERSARERIAWEDKGRRATMMIDSLQMTDPMFQKVQEKINQRMEADPLFKDPRVVRALEDPDAINPQTGKPFFFSLYHETREMLTSPNRKRPATSEGKPEIPAAPTDTDDRMDPGGDTAPAGASRSKNYSKMSREAFKDEINRTLASDD